MAETLAGRVALVTGGGTGIGRAIAVTFASHGAAVAVNYRRSREDAEATVELIRARGGRALAIEADVADEVAVDAMVAQVLKEWGRLDILVNNAGTTAFIPHGELDALTADVWDRILAVNVKGAFFCARAAARVMDEGRIINIGSVAGITGGGSSIAYAASKSAVHTLTKSLARVLAPRITVNAIAPGVIATRWHAGRESETARVAERLPARRLGSPEDVAHVALALATSSNFLTGQVVVVDGGGLL